MRKENRLKKKEFIFGVIAGIILTTGINTFSLASDGTSSGSDSVDSLKVLYAILSIVIVLFVFIFGVILNSRYKAPPEPKMDNNINPGNNEDEIKSKKEVSNVAAC